MIILIPAQERVLFEKTMTTLFSSSVLSCSRPFVILIHWHSGESGLVCRRNICMSLSVIRSSALSDLPKSIGGRHGPTLQISSPTSASLCVFITYLRSPLISTPMHQSSGTITGEMRPVVSGWGLTYAVLQSNLNPTRSLSLPVTLPSPLSSCALNRPLNHSTQALWLVDLSAWLNSHFHHVLHGRVTERANGGERESKRMRKADTQIREVREPDQMGPLHAPDDRHLDQRGGVKLCRACRVQAGVKK